ncbi:MAG TPA: type II secretion system F family protein [Gammaproteobacteria bacterium]|nr:type II secretion system F family protein [Gammaproteobacteria bacterium]
MAEAAKKTFNFMWEGTDRKGNRVKGKANGADMMAIKAHLRRQGIAPLRVRKESQGMFGSGAGKRITAGDIAILSRQMATMMTAGVPLVQAFDIVGKGNSNPRFRNLMTTLKNDVEAGNSLTHALSQQPKYFDDLYVSLVEAGEKAGALEALLDKIATYKEKTEAIKKKIKKAMFYPIAIMVVAVVVTAILLVYVIPQFAKLFQGFGANLPAFTLMVVNLSKFVRGNGMEILIGVAILASAFIWLKKRSPQFRRLLDRVTLQLPVVGGIVKKAIIARFARTLATMFAAGVPLVEALDSIAGACGNILFEEGVLHIRDQVSTGLQLNVAMSETSLFPNMVEQMIAIGEESGSIETMAGKVADFYEEEVDNAVDSMSSLMEPVIMVVLGVLIGGLVIAMYLPIFKMGSVV